VLAGGNAMIRLMTVSSEQRTLLWNIHQKYLYEMTNYYDNEMDSEGNYHYGYFDSYFTDPRRTALLIYRDQTLAGFAMINPYSYVREHPDHVLAEFTVFPGFRRQHLAKAAAEQILEMFPGRWEIKYNEKNTAARNLWNQIAAQYQPRICRYSDTEMVLCFTAK
jgi:predicted acetyltransferase